MAQQRFDLSDAGVLISGASGGIGQCIARALGKQGARLVLTGRNRQRLDVFAAQLADEKIVSTVVVADIGVSEDRIELVREARQALGAIDVLINNAGLEQASYYEDLHIDQIVTMMNVNLIGPMHLARILLPDMLARNRGRIVNIASLAGLTPAGFSEPYGASKHGLVGFTRSLRASLVTRESSVGASVICPGFVRDAGMYDEMARDFGVRVHGALGTSTPLGVAKAVVDAIQNNLGEVIVNPSPVRPLLALGMLSPNLGAWLSSLFKVNDLLHSVAKQRRVSGGRAQS